MEFFHSAIDGSQALVTANGTGLYVWALLTCSKATAMTTSVCKVKQLMTCGGIALVGKVLLCFERFKTGSLKKVFRAHKKPRTRVLSFVNSIR